MRLKQITFKDYSRLTPFFERQPHKLCVYSLPSLIAWSTREYQPYASVVGDALVTGAEFKVKKENRHLLLPISLNGEPSPEDLYDLAETLGFGQYWFVTEDYIHTYGRDRIEPLFVVSRQKEFDDYVYLAEDLSTLKGNRYAKKRNLIHQFRRNYLDKKKVDIESLTSSAASECIDFLDQWCKQRDCDYDEDADLECERRAAVNMIEHIDAVDAQGLVVRVDGVVSAFAVGCRLTETMGVLHFEKAFSHIKGLYQFFDNLCAKRLFNGYKFINKESDMDVPGLARAKRSYHPAMMIRCYKLALR